MHHERRTFVSGLHELTPGSLSIALATTFTGDGFMSIFLSCTASSGTHFTHFSLLLPPAAPEVPLPLPLKHLQTGAPMCAEQRHLQTDAPMCAD